VSEIVDATERFDPHGDLCGFPASVAEVVQVEVTRPAPLGTAVTSSRTTRSGARSSSLFYRRNATRANSTTRVSRGQHLKGRIRYWQTVLPSTPRCPVRPLLWTTPVGRPASASELRCRALRAVDDHLGRIGVVGNVDAVRDQPTPWASTSGSLRHSMQRTRRGNARRRRVLVVLRL
jgi:hypothetical protein